MSNSKFSPRTIAKKIGGMSDTNLLTSITIVVFILMYICAIIFLGKGFLKPQTLFNMLNENAALKRATLSL